MAGPRVKTAPRGRMGPAPRRGGGHRDGARTHLDDDGDGLARSRATATTPTATSTPARRTPGTAWTLTRWRQRLRPGWRRLRQRRPWRRRLRRRPRGGPPGGDGPRRRRRRLRRADRRRGRRVTPVQTWYADGDGDGYGAADRAEAACTQPSGTVANDVDCDDLDAEVQGCLETAAHRLLGGFTGDLAGWRVAAAGDVDGDGLEDVLIGAPEADVGGRDAGKAYLLLGRTLAATDPGDRELEDADHLVEGESATTARARRWRARATSTATGWGRWWYCNSVGASPRGGLHRAGRHPGRGAPGAFPVGRRHHPGGRRGRRPGGWSRRRGRGRRRVRRRARGRRRRRPRRPRRAALLFLGHARRVWGRHAASDADVRLIAAPAAAAGAASPPVTWTGTASTTCPAPPGA